MGLGCASNSIKSKSGRSQNISIEVFYSESADIFEILDNLSDWWPEFVWKEYQEYWLNNFALNKSDRVLLKKYSKIRKKYYNDIDGKEGHPLKNRNGFFSTAGSIDADPVAKAFYSSNLLEEALLKVKKIVSKEEYEFLVKFYAAFSGRYTKLIEESKSGFQGSIQKTKGSLSNPKISEYFNKVASFYNVNERLQYRVLYVWWPPLSRTNATPTGLFLVMRQNPLKHKNLDFSDIVAHEINHSISAHQPIEQKKWLTDEFLKICPIQDKLKRYRIMEEPLAVTFGQLVFNEKFRSKKFSISENLYRNPWINSFSRIIFLPLKTRFESGEKIIDGFIPEAAGLCKDVLDASKKIGG